MIQFTIYKVHLTWPKLTQAIINRNKVIGGDNPAGLNLRIYGFRDPTLGLRPRRRAVGASSLLGGRRSEHVQVHERELRLSDTRVETQVQVPAWSQHTLERDKEVEWGKWSFLYTTTLDTTLSVAETHVIVTAVQCLRLSSRSSGLCSPPGWSASWRTASATVPPSAPARAGVQDCPCAICRRCCSMICCICAICCCICCICLEFFSAGAPTSGAPTKVPKCPLLVHIYLIIYPLRKVVRRFF